MAPEEPRGREMPLLVYLLVASFALMLLSGIMFMMGMPEAQSRAVFMATVIIWLVIGVSAIVDGQLETRRIAAAQVKAKAEAKTEARTEAKAEARTEAKPDRRAKPDEDAPSPKPTPDAEDGLNDP